MERVLIWGLAWAIVLLLFPLCTMKLRKRMADDIALSLLQAHLGKLPKGQYAGQRVYAKRLSRDQLRVPLATETLERMDGCSIVHRHDVQCVGIGCKMRAAAKHATAEVAVSVRFEGETAAGEMVSVDVQDCHLTAELVIADPGWTLVSLSQVDGAE